MTTRVGRTTSLVAVLAMVVTLGLAGCAGGGRATNEASSTAAASATSATDVLAVAVAALPADIVESGELVIATDAGSRPVSYRNDGGELVGWEIELGSQLAARLGLRARFVVKPFFQIIPGVVSGVSDTGIASIFATEERSKFVDFVAYYEAGIAWAAPAGSKVTPDSACGKTVAVRTGTVQETVDLPTKSAACVKAGQGPIVIKGLPDQEQITNEVVLGYADAFSADSPVTADAVLQSSGRLVQVGRVYDMYLCGMPVSKDQPGLARALNLALADLQLDGTYGRLLGKWGVEVGAIRARDVVSSGS